MRRDSQQAFDKMNPVTLGLRAAYCVIFLIGFFLNGAVYAHELGHADFYSGSDQLHDHSSEEDKSHSHTFDRKISVVAGPLPFSSNDCETSGSAHIHHCSHFHAFALIAKPVLPQTPIQPLANQWGSYSCFSAGFQKAHDRPPCFA